MSLSILIVEDSYLFASSLAQWVVGLGLQVLGPAKTQDHALELIAAGRVDGGIVDINLGGTDAWQVPRALLARNLPFILFTVYPLTDLPRWLRGIPCLPKLTSESELRAALARTLRTAGHPLH
jgi:CheY-like chemotaxis protein